MTIEEILQSYKKVTVVGLSPNPDRDSYAIAMYLKNTGYEVQGVHPHAPGSVNGIPVYPSLTDAPQPLEIVDVFRRSEFVPDLVDELLTFPPKVLWLQLGVTHAEAEARAQAAGIQVVSDRCILVEHRNLNI